MAGAADRARSKCGEEGGVRWVMRVVSLLPSATEILRLIGVTPGSEPAREPVLVARSHECDAPADVLALPALTAARTHYASQGSAGVDQAVRAALAEHQSLYTLDEAALAALQPDLIVTQDLCAVCSIDLAAVRRVADRLSPSPAVLSLNPQTLEGVLDDVLAVGGAVGLEERARLAVVALRERLYAAQDYVNFFAEGPNVAFLEWTDPLFVGGHWTPQLIERAGGRCPLNPTEPVNKAGAAAGPIGTTLRRAGKSVTVPAEVLAASRPEAIIIAPCGLALEDAWRETANLSRQSWWADLPAVRRGKVAVVDGHQMFNRPGPRLVDAFEWLVGWLNDRPELIPASFPWRAWARGA